jgi:glycosyltransferase involved in cell wall biosynthesis
VLIVSGIWPPDVGGPASHAPELAAYLAEHGDRVEVLITADRPPAPEPYPVHWVSRRIPAGPRHAAVAAQIARRARAADVVYATSMLGRASLGATAARRPLVVKLVADEAYERAKRRGLYDGTLDDFQRHRGGPAVRALRATRNLLLSRVHHLVCPSEYLAGLAVSWGVPRDRVTVLPNPAPPVPTLRDPGEIRRELGVDGRVAAFAGRLTRQKALEVAFRAVSEVDGLTLLVAGDGPDRARYEDAAREIGLAGRVRFLGPLDRVGVLELFRAADVSLLSSAWENFPHTVVEALAVGTPVVATATGGVAEVVCDGANGLLVEPGDAEALAAALRRFFDDGDLRARLRANAAPSVEPLSTASVYGRLHAILHEAAR